MKPGPFLWVGMNLSVAGVLMVLLVQLTGGDSWRVVASCDDESTVSGSIAAEAGSHVIEVFVTYHVPGSSEWLPVPGASQTLTVEGPGPHSFGPLDVSATPLEANSIRVEIEVAGNPTNAKSESFTPCGPPLSTATQTPATSTQPPSTATQPPPTSTQPPSTATQPIATSTAPVSTATQPPPTSTQPPSTATQPPPTSTQPPSTATQPPPTSTQPPSTATQPVATSTTPASAGAATATPTLISEERGVVTQVTPTVPPGGSIRGIPNAGDGGLLAEHRTSLTVLGIGLIFLGMMLMVGRGLVDVRRT